MAGDEERHRLVQVAGHEAQVAAQQLRKDGALGPTPAGLVDDPKGALEGSVARPHLVRAHLDGAWQLLAQGGQVLGLGHLLHPQGRGQIGGDATTPIRCQNHMVLHAVELLDGPLQHRKPGHAHGRSHHLGKGGAQEHDGLVGRRRWYGG